MKKTKKMARFALLFFLQAFAWAGPKAISDGVTSATLSNGVALHTKTTASNVSSLYIVLKGTGADVGDELAGLPKLTLALMQDCCKARGADELRKFSFDTHTEFNTYSTVFGSVFGFSALNKYFDEALSTLLSMLTEPTFEEKEYKALMEGARQTLQRKMNDPMDQLTDAVDEDRYQDSPAARSLVPTDQSINNLTLDKMKAYQKTLLSAARLEVVFVGSLQQAALQKKLNPTLGALPPGTPPKTLTFPTPTTESAPKVLLNDAAKRSAYLMRVFPMAATGSEDFPAAKLTATIYEDVLFNIVRENYGVCYSPQSGVSGATVPYGYELLYRTTDFKNFSKRLAEARDILASGRVTSGRDEKGNFTFEALDGRLPGFLSAYINNLFQNSTTTDGLAVMLSGSVLQFSSVKGLDELTAKVMAVSADDVVRVFKKYWLAPTYKWYAVTAPSDKGKLKFD